MLVQVSPGRQFFSFNSSGYLQSRLIWALVVSVLIALRSIWGTMDILLNGGGDTDDITRLLQVRELAANGDWWSRTLSQIGAPDALQSHWSRLIDLPLLLLTSLLGIFVSLENAEMAVRIIWPTALLAAMIFLVMREAERQAGAMAAVAVLVLVATVVSAVFQFNPGRIDHHNVQILTTIVGILFLQRSFTEPSWGWGAGALFGLGLAIGLEAMVLVGAIIAIGVLIGIFCSEMREGLYRTLLACTGVAWAAFLLTVAPWQWLQPACDELALNLLLLLSFATSTYALLHRCFASAGPGVWLAGLCAGGGLGIAAYLALEPACAGGPFAMADPALKSIWLDRVKEGQSLLEYAEKSPAAALSFLVCVTLGCVVLPGLAYFKKKDAISLFALLAMICATFYSFLYIKLMPYAMWLAIPAIAVAIARLPAIGETPARTVGLAALLLVNQTTISLMLATAIGMFSTATTVEREQRAGATQACQASNHYHALNALPEGLIFNEIDFGPFIALNSKHRVVSAPYHRIDKSIIDTFDYLRLPPTQSRSILDRLQADYVIVCRRSAAQLAKMPKNSTLYALLSGVTPAYLEKISIKEGKTPLLVWRVKR